MCCQVALNTEGFSTFLANIRLFSAMNSFVGNEITHCIESFVANVALEWLLATVDSLMFNHCGHLTEEKKNKSYDNKILTIRTWICY